MALLNFMGFESGNSLAGLLANFHPGGLSSASLTYARTGQYSLLTNWNGPKWWHPDGEVTSLYVGFGIFVAAARSTYLNPYCPGFTSGVGETDPTDASGQWGPYLKWRSEDTIFDVYRRDETGAEVLVAEWPVGVPAIGIGTWAYIEIALELDGVNGTGAMEVMVNGTSFISIPSGTRLMQETTLNTVRRITWEGHRFSSSSYGYYIYFDDLYICDGAGTRQNSLLGPQRVHPLTPAGQGLHNDFIGSDGDNVDSHLLVDEVPFDSVDYVESSTVGSKYTATASPIPPGVTFVNAVQVHYGAVTEPGGAGSARSLVRSGLSEAAGADVAITESHANKLGGVVTVDPDTGSAWTRDAVNAVELGIEHRA